MWKKITNEKSEQKQFVLDDNYEVDKKRKTFVIIEFS